MKLKTILISLLFTTTLAQAQPALEVEAHMDHFTWSWLLQKHVNELGLVDYESWNNSIEDKDALRNYVKQFEPVPQTPAVDGDKIASLINAYNALTILWILDNYPTPSIKKTDNPWKEDRWLVGGQKVSLDDIEHKGLRPLIGWKVHSAVVCAARSCPPLQNEAYYKENYEALIETAYIDWLARTDLNQFNAKKKIVKISKIFSWYKGDFKEGNSIKDTLLRFAPEEHKPFLETKKYKIKYLSYDWDLNEQKEIDH